jgi:predicted amidohydrolase YtcJ
MAADEIYLNGKIITMEPRCPAASAFAVEGSRFAVVGSEENARAIVSKHTRTIDLEGRSVIPWFIETHCHLFLYAMIRLQADCAMLPNQSIKDIKDRLWKTARRKMSGRWARGRRCDDSLIAKRRHLTYQDIDDACPETPVSISHTSGHLAYANALALEIAGIGCNCPESMSGEIKLGLEGRTTGILKEESAQSLVNYHITPYDNEQLKGAMLKAVEDYYHAGITSAYDATIGYFRTADKILMAYEQLVE